MNDNDYQDDSIDVLLTWISFCLGLQKGIHTHSEANKIYEDLEWTD